MASRVGHKKHHGALKHGGYSALRLLPGESAEEFERLRKDLVEEMAPRGPLEEDMFRLSRGCFGANRTVRHFESQCRREHAVVKSLKWNITTSFQALPFGQESDETLAARKEAARFANEQAQRELGDSMT
jgi:hypothetical protein